MSGVEPSLSNKQQVGLLKVGCAVRRPQESFSVILGWPITAWRVLVPAPQMHETDPLQRAILRLSKAGARTPEEVGRWLDINTDLARALQYLFLQRGLLSLDGKITPQGEALLEDEDSLVFSDTSHTEAWIFRDSLTGDLVPTLYTSDLVRLDAEEVSVLPREQAYESKPSVAQIRDALRQYQKHVAASRLSQKLGERLSTDYENQEDVEMAAEGVIPGVVQVVWERPEFYSLPVYLYVTADAPQEVEICTGFREAGTDHWFKEKLRWAVSQNRQVKEIITAFLQQAANDFPAHPSLPEAEARTMAELPILKHPALADTLQYLAKAYRGEVLYKQNPENIDVLLGRYQSTLEALFDACIRTMSKPQRERVGEHVASDDSGFTYQISQIAGSLNIALPSPFAKFNPRKIKHIGFTGRAMSLRERALFLVCCADLDPSSNAAKAFRISSDLLNHVDKVADSRNQQLHYTGRRAPGDELLLIQQVGSSVAHIINILGESYFRDSLVSR